MLCTSAGVEMAKGHRILDFLLFNKGLRTAPNGFLLRTLTEENGSNKSDGAGQGTRTQDALWPICGSEIYVLPVHTADKPADGHQPTCCSPPASTQVSSHLTSDFTWTLTTKLGQQLCLLQSHSPHPLQHCGPRKQKQPDIITISLLNRTHCYPPVKRDEVLVSLQILGFSLLAFTRPAPRRSVLSACSPCK